MVVSEQYYQIVERETELVSSKWKVIHLVALAVAAVSGGLVAFNVGRMEHHFGMRCILNSKIVFSHGSEQELLTTTPTAISSVTEPTFSNSTEELSSTETEDSARNLPTELEGDESNSTSGVINETTKTPEVWKRPKIDLDRTCWGKISLCEFCQFTPIFSTITAIIWWAFFALLTKGGKGYSSDILPKPWRIVYPFLFFAIIITCCLIASTVYLMDGLYNFCIEFRPILNNTWCVAEMNVYTLQFNNRQRPFYLNYALTKIFSYTALSAWVIQIVALIWRILVAPDFEVYVVTLREQKERVTKITEYSEHSDPLTDVTEVTEV